MAAIAFVMGSDSDLPILKSAFDILDHLGLEYDVRVLSAHRTPKETQDFAAGAEENGVQCIIAAAGMAAHLAGVISAHSKLPVIGVPMPGGALNGLDALYATVQMPGGVPVATMGIGKAGAINAALFAVRMLALNNADLRDRLADYITEQAQAVLAKDKKVSAEYGQG